MGAKRQLTIAAVNPSRSCFAILLARRYINTLEIILGYLGLRPQPRSQNPYTSSDNVQLTLTFTPTPNEKVSAADLTNWTSSDGLITLGPNNATLVLVLQLSPSEQVVNWGFSIQSDLPLDPGHTLQSCGPLQCLSSVFVT